MRLLFIVLVLANLALFAMQFGVVRRVVLIDTPAVRPPPLNAERLRIVRDQNGRGSTTPVQSKPTSAP